MAKLSSMSDPMSVSMMTGCGAPVEELHSNHACRNKTARFSSCAILFNIYRYHTIVGGTVHSITSQIAHHSIHYSQCSTLYGLPGNWLNNALA